MRTRVHLMLRSFAVKPPLLPPRADCDRHATSISVVLHNRNFYVQHVLRPEDGTPVIWQHTTVINPNYSASVNIPRSTR